MELARWLIAFVAFTTGIGGLLADYFLASGAQHIKNPRWSPHAKFHNAQGILMGVLLASLTIALLFHRRVLGRETLLLAALIASVYWLSIFAAPIFPGIAFVDPEFAAGAPNVGKVPLQLAIGFVLVGLLVIAVAVGFIWS
jgi:hypothetical protein